MKKYNCTKMNETLTPHVRGKSRSRSASGNFKNYLRGKEYSSTTIATYEKLANQFLEWMHKENLETDQVRYQDILAYMKHCSGKKGHSQRTVQHTVTALGHYFDCLQEMQQTEGNPTKGIKVQGVKRKTLYHILEPVIVGR
jgi:site-specific recombinase XerD